MRCAGLLSRAWLGLGVPSPQQEDDRGGQGIEQPDDLIGQDLPSLVRV